MVLIALLVLYLLLLGNQAHGIGSDIALIRMLKLSANLLQS